MVNVVCPIAPVPNVNEAGEVELQVGSAGREDVIPKVREAQAIESVLVTDTVKLAGDPAFTEALA